MVFEVNIGLTVHRKQMDMRMVYLETQHNLCHFLAGKGRLNGPGYALGKHFELGQISVFHVEDIVYFLARNDQRVTLCHRIDVEKRIELVAFGAFIAWDFACGNL